MPRLKSLGIWGAIHAYAAKYRHWIGEGSLIGKMGSDKIRTEMAMAVCTSYDRPYAVCEIFPPGLSWDSFRSRVTKYRDNLLAAILLESATGRSHGIPMTGICIDDSRLLVTWLLGKVYLFCL